MPETSHGIIYPESTDHTRLWEHFQNLAESADTAVGNVTEQAIQSGTATVPITADGTSSTVPVTFDPPFASAPVVVASAAVGRPDRYFGTATGITANGFSALGVRAAGTATTIPIKWIAVGTPAS